MYSHKTHLIALKGTIEIGDFYRFQFYLAWLLALFDS